MTTEEDQFMPIASTATDIFALGTQVEGFDWASYQDIQNDQAMYDSFQRWPFLFALAMNKRYLKN
jgi:hypothetical protein